MQGLPHIGARGFGISQVKGLRRVPEPPAKIIDWILFKSIHIPIKDVYIFPLKSNIIQVLYLRLLLLKDFLLPHNFSLRHQLTLK